MKNEFPLHDHPSGRFKPFLFFDTQHGKEERNENSYQNQVSVAFL
jgi:hypothetical protein